MIRRLYIHHFRCLENFDLPIAGQSSVLLIGKNGSGKTTVGLALQMLQSIARGKNRVSDLLQPKDLPFRLSEQPARLEIEVELEARLFQYSIAFEFPPGFKEMRVLDERLEVGGSTVYSRELAQVRLGRTKSETEFRIDWHLAALPIIQEQSESDPLFVFKKWLSHMLILRPAPGLINGDSQAETLQPNIQVTDFGDWFSGVLALAPGAYTRLDTYLKQVMPDFQDIKNPASGRDSRSMVVQFAGKQGTLALPFDDLSDGEKCFMVCALVLAANRAYGPLFCFWDEPDSYLAPSEVQHFVLALREAFASTGGQFVATTHDPEAIRAFSHDNTLLLYRESHLEPTRVRKLTEGDGNGDLVGALVRGDLE